jgi:hypothetical protein
MDREQCRSSPGRDARERECIERISPFSVRHANRDTGKPANRRHPDGPRYAALFGDSSYQGATAMAIASLRTIGTFAVAVLVVLPPPSALAQEIGAIPVPAVEVSAGYTFMRDFARHGTSEGHVDFPAGWYLSGAANVNRWFGIVGEFTGSYKNNLDLSTPGWSESSDLRVYTLMAGPRFFRPSGRIAPFAQMLTGVAHLRERREHSGLPNQFTWTTTQFALQPGIGLTVHLTDRVGVRFSGDYRTLIEFDDGADYTHEFRLLSGFTFNWGAR